MLTSYTKGAEIYTELKGEQVVGALLVWLAILILGA